MKAIVLIPTLGISPWLHESLGSVTALHPQVVARVICPQSASTELEVRWPMVEVVPDQRSGLYAALNTGLGTLDDADLVTWLNDDDLLCSAGSRAALDIMAKERSIDVTYGEVGLIDSDGRSQGRLAVAKRVKDLPALLARGVVPLAQPGTWLRGSLLRRLKGFDESFRLAGDLDLFSRALKIGARFQFLPEMVACFRLRAGQLSKDEGTGDREKIRALSPWIGVPKPIGALLRFRYDNSTTYADRIRRHGFVSMRTLYRRQ